MLKNTIKIHKKLESINKKLYIVGGFCREMILGEIGDGDIDLVTDAKPEEMSKVLNVVGEVGKKYGTCIVSSGGEIFELTTFRKDIGSVNYRKPADVEFTDSIEEDAKRRDFTINAIYYDPIKKTFIDPENGIDDLKNRVIRFVGNIEDRIKEDGIRILRFIRFKNKYNLKIADKNYTKILKENVKILENIAIERIKQELDRMLLEEKNIEMFEDLKQIGFLKIFIPELDSLDKYLGNKYHLEGNVWIHTKMCLGEMNKLIIKHNFTQEKKLLLLWSILLHDIGKGPTYSLGKDGNAHYYNHDRVGADMFKRDISKRFKFPNDFEKEITFIIEQHLRLFKMPQMKKLKARKLMISENFDDLMLVGEADNKGRIPVDYKGILEIKNMYKSFKKLLKTKKFYTGEDIIEKFPELKGREIGERLKQINEQVLAKD